MIISDYQCPKCKKVIESDKQIDCQKCKIEMVKLFGGRSNSSGHDYRFRDN